MKHLLFFLLLIIPAGLRADLITPNGYGSFSCTYSAADSGYVVDGQLSFVAQDAQGNPLDATLHFGMQNASPCAPGLPGLVALAQPGVGMGLSGNWDYLGHNYTALSWPNGSGWCESNLPGDLCSAALISDGVGNLGIQLIQQVPAGGTEGNDDGTPASDPSPGGNGNLILSPFYGLEEASNDPFVTLQIAGPITITSLDYGVNNDDCFDPTTYASGTFTVGCVPEPAEWGLLVAALPILIFKYRRSKK